MLHNSLLQLQKIRRALMLPNYLTTGFYQYGIGQRSIPIRINRLDQRVLIAT